MTTLIKLGGSLVTDKREAKSYHRHVVQDIARQFSELRSGLPEFRLVVGHGSGSFGHVEASKYNTVEGVCTEEEWLGFAKVGAVATELSQRILSEFIRAGLPAIRFQPSSMLRSKNRKIAQFETNLLERALNLNLLPLIHGDIAIDESLGGTIISTETIFAALVEPLGVREIVLLGEVPGVLDGAGKVIPEITPSSLPELVTILGRSRGVDVTGGMLHKVQEMVELVTETPLLKVYIADGERENVLIDMLVHRRKVGSVIHAGA